MPMRLVYVWSARVKHAVLRRISSNTLPRHAAYFSDGTTLGYRSWSTPWPRWTVCVLLKTRNQLNTCTQFDPKTLDSLVHYVLQCRRKGKGPKNNYVSQVANCEQPGQTIPTNRFSNWDSFIFLRP